MKRSVIRVSGDGKPPVMSVPDYAARRLHPGYAGSVRESLVYPSESEKGAKIEGYHHGAIVPTCPRNPETKYPWISRII